MCDRYAVGEDVLFFSPTLTVTSFPKIAWEASLMDAKYTNICHRKEPANHRGTGIPEMVLDDRGHLFSCGLGKVPGPSTT